MLEVTVNMVNAHTREEFSFTVHVGNEEQVKRQVARLLLARGAQIEDLLDWRIASKVVRPA
jgi:hypothetical protein